MSADKLGFSANFVDLVSAIALRLYQAPDLTHVFQTTVVEVQKLLQVDRVMIYQLGAHPTAEILAEATADTCPPLPFRQLDLSACLDWWAQNAIAVQSISALNREVLSPYECSLLAPLQIQAGIMAPIHLQSQWPELAIAPLPASPSQPLWGFLVVHHYQSARTWSPIQLSFVRQLAQHLFHSIRQHQLRLFSERLIESTVDGILALDRDYRYQVWNSAMESMTGVPREQVLGRVAWEIFPFLKTSGEDAFVAAAMEGNTVVARDRIFRTPQSGQTRFFEARYSPLLDSNHQVVGCLGMVRDISEQKQSEYRLQAATTRLSTLIQSLQTGVLLEDETRKILLTNQIFCDLFQVAVSPDMLKGQNCSQMATQTQALFQHPMPVLERIEQIVAARMPVLGEEVPLTDGRVLERDYVPIQVGDRYLGHLWQYRDISDRKQAQQQLEQARLAAEAENKAKSNFLATVSHEIRTPLNAMIGVGELLSITDLNDEQQEFVEIIRNSSSMLLSLINDILDLSKIEAQKLDLEWRAFDLHRCLRDTLKLMAPLAAEKNLEVRSHIAPDVPQRIVGDIMRLRQILINLINNAIKFTHQGTIELRLSLHHPPATGTEFLPEIREKGQVPAMCFHETPLDFYPNASLANEPLCELCFMVQDTGVGIPPERQGQLFEAFRQVDASVTRRYGGTGLGLAICKSLVEAMGGQIAVESQPGKGSTFQFTIRVPQVPLVESQRPGLLLLEAESGMGLPLQRGELGPLKILVVDDLLVNQKVAVKMLEALGYKADRAAGGTDAIAALSHIPYDIILMDIQMPEMDGYATTHAIRQLSLPQEQPWIIAITAHSQMEDRQRCFQVGMNDFLSKPIVSEALVGAFQRYRQGRPVAAMARALPLETATPSAPLSPSSERVSLPPAPLPNEPTDTVDPLLDDSILEDLCQMVGDDDDGIMADLLLSYQQESYKLLGLLQSAVQQAIHDQIRHTAHSLRSMSLNLGAVAFGNLCRDLELNHAVQSPAEWQISLQNIEAMLPKVHHALYHHKFLQRYVQSPSQPVPDHHSHCG